MHDLPELSNPAEPANPAELPESAAASSRGDTAEPTELIRDPIRELKIRAELLHHGVTAAEPKALARLRVLAELRSLGDTELAAIAPEIRRKHCLATVARECGFTNWQHASTVLGVNDPEDFGTMLCPTGAAAFWNIWSATYEEAQTIRQEHGGYLLAYKRHFFIVERAYIEMLGLDPDDADWKLIGRDWARPAVPAARQRLYGKLLARSRPSTPNPHRSAAPRLAD